MKSLYKTERLVTPIKLDKAIVDQIDAWADHLSMTRSGMLRLMLRVAGPIMDCMVNTMSGELRTACRRIQEGTTFLHLRHDCAVTGPADKTSADDRRQPDAARGQPVRRAQKPGGGQKDARPAQGRDQTAAQTKSQPAREARRAVTGRPGRKARRARAGQGKRGRA